ncbi:MAG TPA: hypothetical protein VGN49_08130 [Micrococcaceae bacterium]|jgi:hypothetical protein|nr:hypothetical protein [Micrococcaceae bacterium]
MPWWSWIVIWIALVALSLLYVALLGIKVWRDFRKTAKSLETAGNRLREHGQARRAELEAQLAPAMPRVQGVAVFASPEQMKDDYTAAKAARVSQRRRRRVARRAERGQPQSLRDIGSQQTILQGTTQI